MLSADYLGFCPPKDVGVLPSPQQTRPPPAILISRADPFFEGGGDGRLYLCCLGRGSGLSAMGGHKFHIPTVFFCGGDDDTKVSETYVK